jgi:hypothetical protein
MTLAAQRSFNLEQIEPDRIEDALGPLDSAARWLAGKGIEQWPMSFTQSPERCRKLEEEAERGNVFVAYALNQPAGTITITDWQDPDFAAGWPERPEGSAQYVMRLAVSHFGRRLIPGLGTRLLDYALYLTEFRGADVVRLDCSRLNNKLHNYYKANGYDVVGEVAVPGRKSGKLFERNVR